MSHQQGYQLTSPGQPGQPPFVQQGYGVPPQPAKAKKQLNVLGLIALITAVLGFIFACTPGALIVGWILLPIAFVLSLVSLFLKDRAKWMGIAALILSVVGTIVGVIVFFAAVGTSFDNAFGSGDTKVLAPSGDAGVKDGAAGDKLAADAGTRENPSPIGSVIENKDWRVVINSVTLAATDAVVAANSFNKPPTEGSEYILVNYSATYIGDDPDGQTPAFVSIEYVTANGTTVNGLDNFVVAPESIDTMSTLYKDGTTTGNKAIEVPTATAGQGVLAVRAGMLADKTFVAVQ
ncbi:hypothetical protein [Arthrobacter rhizosphaerae]|uniref:hypothetical protein n=1 Tax=Arthrobacter rhizosphaerae TaxID=2855490 RepID=UPI001FF446F5|nr:hypothetical protein [Arthrobacter rhizosphaerae]